jgi:hypothetical protein
MVSNIPMPPMYGASDEEEAEDDLVIREELPPEKPAHVFKFSKLEIFFGTIVGIIFGLISLLEVTAPFLGGLEAWYYKRKGLTSTVWLTSFGVGFLLGLVPVLNFFVYVINFWVIVYIDRHPKLEAITQKVGSIGSKIKGSKGIHPTNAPRPIEHEVSPTTLNHEVAAPTSSRERLSQPATAPDRRRAGPEKESKPLNVLEQADRDLEDPTISEKEALFESPTDPFAAGRKAREEESEREEMERRQKATREASVKNEDIEERANTGTAFMRQLEKNLAGTGDVVETPPPAPLPNLNVTFEVQPGETVDLKRKNIDREAA